MKATGKMGFPKDSGKKSFQMVTFTKGLSIRESRKDKAAFTLGVDTPSTILLMVRSRGGR